MNREVNDNFISLVSFLQFYVFHLYFEIKMEENKI